MKNYAEKENRPILIIGFLVVLLMFLVSFANKHEEYFKISKLVLHSAVTCKELDTQLRPIGEAVVFPPDSRQVCFWLRFSDAREGDQLHIVWTHNSTIIHKESLYLKEREGTCAFYLVRADGAPLSKGNYTVTIRPNRERDKKIAFKISTAP